MASTGHKLLHALHPMQSSGLITATPFTKVMAFTGQIDTHAPQPTHLFLSTIIMAYYPLLLAFKKHILLQITL